MDATSEQALFGLFAVLGGFLIVIFIILIAMFVLRALALYTMAKRKNIANAWLAWIPLAQEYILGMILNKKITVTSTISIPYAQWILVGLNVLTAATYDNEVLSSIVLIISLVITVLALLRLYKLYAPDKAVLYTVLSVVIPITSPIIMMMIRNNTPVEYDFTEYDGFDSNQKDDNNSLTF